jgi:hypothetical protein
VLRAALGVVSQHLLVGEGAITKNKCEFTTFIPHKAQKEAAQFPTLRR